MKLIFQDFKKGDVKLMTTSLDDLWYLSNIIDKDDTLTGRTIRKIKLGDDERNTKIVKKVVTLAIKVERVEFHKYSNSLRVSGKITSAPEDIPKGSYHTFDITENTSLKITKSHWLSYQIEKLKESTEEQTSKTLICAIDRESATFAILTPSGYRILSEIEGEVQKKEADNKKTKDFYAEIAKILQDYKDREDLQNIILASPAFWKEDLLKKIKKNFPALAKIIFLATCNSLGKNGVEEVLKRKEVETVLKKDRTTKETILVEELLKEISLDQNAAYGLEEVIAAGDASAIKKLLITDELIHALREQEQFDSINELMKKVDKTKGEVHIITTDHESGKKLQGLGGIGAILRYKLKY
jgi:protein pelota